MPFPPTCRADACALDRSDPLAAAREAFELPEKTIYLVGHSLGPPPKSARAKVRAAEQAWREDLVRSWNSAGWIDLAERTGARIARLIGAPEGSVIITDNVTVNLFKLASAALTLSQARHLSVEEDEFPTDQYIVSALGQQSRLAVHRLAPGGGLDALRQGGVLVKSVVSYRSGEVADIGLHEEEARRHGAVIVWDLSHAAGILNLALEADGARLAAGCTYKYLNGGPGAPAFAYVAGEITARVTSPLPGWMGHAAPFAFDAAYTPREGAARFASGTPPILSLAALDGALDAISGQEMRHLQSKAANLGAIAVARAKALGLEVLSPQEAAKRGGHVSLRLADGYPVVQALAARGVLADFRAPDTVRLGFSPLFLSYAEVWDAADALADILRTRSWDQPAFHARAKVT
ncbi:MAG: aminotransferase class V-fold PLP-dependent enzyme [Hyphomonas sp.]